MPLFEITLTSTATTKTLLPPYEATDRSFVEETAQRLCAEMNELPTARAAGRVYTWSIREIAEPDAPNAA